MTDNTITDFLCTTILYFSERKGEHNGVSLLDLLKTSKYAINKRNKANGIDLLADINSGTVATAFFDPQYRGILDKLSYGNEGESRGKARCELTQMDDNTIKQFIREINRVLKNSGYLFLWVDKFHLCAGLHKWFEDTSLNIVDLVVWDKCKIGMGYRTRRKCEYLVICQKPPIVARDWSDHSIPDVWSERTYKTHPHSKPVDLQKHLIGATTKVGEYVLDPASGGYSVFDACIELGIDFIGCDIEFDENCVNGNNYDFISELL